MRYFITYKLEGLTEYLAFNGAYYSFETKAQAQRALDDEKKANPEIKGWRIVRRYI